MKGLRHVHPHMLRHTFASHLVIRKQTLKATQELLGHSTVLMTMRYAHLSPEAKIDAVAALDQNNPSVGALSQTVPASMEIRPAKVYAFPRKKNVG